MYTKKQQVAKRRIKPTQKQLGSINDKTRQIVKDRSNGICERCGCQRATQMAHIIGRKQLNNITTDKDLLHLCVSCHAWLDQTPEGIIYKRRLVDEQSNWTRNDSI